MNSNQSLQLSNVNTLTWFIFSLSAESTLNGYINLISPVKTAANKKSKYFDMKLQTSENDTVRLVCFSPEKRTNLHQTQLNQTPVTITEVKQNTTKIFSSMEEYTIPKKSKIIPGELDFPYNTTLSNRFHTVSEALAANLYETVGLKVKIMTKSEDKETVVHGNKTRYKTDAIVADETSSVKLVLWENTIDKIETGKSYQIENCKIRIFDDCKFINTNEITKITQIADITNVNLDTPDLQDHIITGLCLGIDIKRSTSCIFCNKTLQQSQLSGPTVKCPNCQITMLISTLKTKLVCELLMQVGDKISSYTAFNDAIQSFCINRGYDESAADVDS